jgi:N-acetylneuraminic acid mutarotase
MPLQQLKPLPNPRSSFGHASVNNTIIVGGGHPGPFHQYEPSNFSRDVHIYDMLSDSWSPLAPLPFAMQGFRLIHFNNYLYGFGGFRFDPAAKSGKSWPARTCNTILRYSLQQDSWEIIGEMPRPRSSYVAEVVQNQAYIIGGWDATPVEPGDKKGRFYTTVDVFNLATECFEASDYTLPLPLRRGFTSCVANEKIIVAGGLGISGFMGGELFDIVQSFEPNVDANIQWTNLADFPEPLFAPGLGYVNQTFHLAGGTFSFASSRRGMSSNKIYSLAQGDNTWTELNEILSSNRSFVEVIELPNNNVAFLGGHNGIEVNALPVGDFEVL